MTTVGFDPAVFDTPEYWRNPYPQLKVLRDHFPLYHDERRASGTSRATTTW